MPLGDDKTTITAVVSTEMKIKLKQVAKVRRWSLSQAVGALIEDSIEDWIEKLGIEPEKPSTPKTSKKKSVS